MTLLRPRQTREGTVLPGTGVETWCIDEHRAMTLKNGEPHEENIPIQWFAAANQRTSLASPPTSEIEALDAIELQLRRDLAAVETYRKKLQQDIQPKE